MARKDILAAGARKATYLVSGKADDAVELKNVAPEGSWDDTVPVVEKAEIKKMRFIPSTGTILVRQNEAEATSSLLIDTKEKDKPAEGVVVETSKRSKVERGDVIVFGKYAGAQFKLNGEDFLLMEETEIKGFLVDYDA